MSRLDPGNLPVVFLAFANDRDDRARYLRNLADEARRLREALAPAERVDPEAARPLSVLLP